MSFSQRALEQAITWFVALQDEACEQTTRERFQQWLSQHESHVAAYARAEHLWGNLDQLVTDDIPGLKAARAAQPRQWRSAISAGVGLLCIAIAAGWWLDYRVEAIELATGIGERRNLTLADGSQIQLNAATRLSAKVSWCRRQVVLQQGEAMFDVAHRTFPSFSVQVGNMRILDIGTRFDVHMRSDDSQVSVLEGEVELKRDGALLGDSLKAGFSRRFDKSGRLQAVQVANADQADAWLNGRLLFDRAPLSEVAYELERQHDLSFVFADPSLANETLSGSFDAADLKPFLNAVEKILPIRVQHQHKKVILSRRRP